MDAISAIGAGFIGAVLGNFATSPMYRLPRGLPISKDNPYCDACHAPLQPRDLFPVLSWLANRGQCRFCGVPIPSGYFWVELGFTLISLVACALHGLTERYLLLMLTLGGLLAAGAMLQRDRFVSWRMLMVPLVASLLWAALRDGSLQAVFATLPWVALPLMLGVYLEREKQQPQRAAGWFRHALALGLIGLWLVPVAPAPMTGWALALHAAPVLAYGVYMGVLGRLRAVQPHAAASFACLLVILGAQLIR